MRKIYLALGLMVTLCAHAEWISPGKGTTYTFAQLADLCDIGTANSGQYLIAEDITISANDKLTLDGVTLLAIDEDCQLTILGEAEFTPDVRVTIGTDSDSAGRSILVDEDGKANFSNLDFDGLGILSSSSQAISVSQCTFSNVYASASSMGAVSFMGQSDGNVIEKCEFTDCEVPAIASAGNAYCGMSITECVITNCNTSNTNKPMINITQPGAGKFTKIENCTIQGAQLNMVGGMSVSDLLSGETGKVEICGNTVRDCRYGLNLMGPMEVRVHDNKFLDNRYESNPMNGGSGISATAYSGRMVLTICDNEISGNMWGVTLISYALFYPDYYEGFGSVSLGDVANADASSPGNNVFSNNGNDGTAYDPSQPYDLYNNTDQTVYAQNNQWSTDPALAIYDKADNVALGEVIYEPVMNGIYAVKAATLHYDATTATLCFTAPTNFEIYTMDGRCVVSRYATSSVSVAQLAHGLYLARTSSATIKFRR